MLNYRIRQNRFIISTTLIVLLIFFALSCKECPTEPDYDIYLSVEDVFCTSVTLTVTLPDSGGLNTFALDRNDSTVLTLSCTDDDTLITDEGLTPDTDYTYRVRFLKDGKTKAESDPVAVHTLPTTSHDFIWEIDTLGNYGSYLKDAWIVDENNIWVVGNIETDSGEYNAAHWNGNEWELLGIYSNTLDLYGIFYFSDDDIWVTDFCSPIHWNGEEWTLYHIQNIGLDACAGAAIWGTSSSNLYFVGYQGSIVHYDGSTFRKMNSGTPIDLEDVYGSGTNVYATGSKDAEEYSGQSVALHGRNGTWETVRHEYAFYPQKYSDWGKICSPWAYGKYGYFMAYSGLMRYNPENDNVEEWFSVSEMNTFHLNIIKLKGNALNDIIHINNWAHIVHYNGETWLPIEDVFNQYPDGGIDVEGMDFKGDVVAIVGFTRYYSNAAVVRGYR